MNNINKLIENVMGFEFDKLELAGYIKTEFEEEMIFYKYGNKIFMFELEDNEITSISDIKIKKYNGNWTREIVINGEEYEYRVNKKIIIDSGNYIEISSNWPRETIKIDENYKLFVNKADMVAAVMIGNYLEDEIINSIGDD